MQQGRKRGGRGEEEWRRECGGGGRGTGGRAEMREKGREGFITSYIVGF